MKFEYRVECITMIGPAREIWRRRSTFSVSHLTNIFFVNRKKFPIGVNCRIKLLLLLRLLIKIQAS